MGTTFSQLFPPHASLTQENLPNQTGKVFLITGGTSGVGYHLATLLFQAGGRVYITGRTETKAREAIASIKAETADAAKVGQLDFILLELDDLSSIKASTEAFKQKEDHIDVLWNNAGVSSPPVGTVTKQNYELQLGTNCLGPYLFTRLLLPELRKAAASQSAAAGSVRVVWTSSLVVDTNAPKGGMDMADLQSTPPDTVRNYVTSKTGNWYLASELAREVGPEGIISLTQNPGTLRTPIWRHSSKLMVMALRPVLSNPKLGADTSLWSGLAPEAKDMAGGYVIPWGRKHPSPRKDLLDALKSKDDGGTGQAAEFRDWCTEQIAEFM